MAGFDRPLKTTGRFLLVPEGGLIWRVETPFPSVTVITRSGLLQKTEGGEATRISAAKLPLLARLHEFLTGALRRDMSVLTQDFEIIREGDAGEWRLLLTPRPQNDALAKTLRAITLSGGQFLERASVERGNGDTEEIRFHDESLAKAGLSLEDQSLLNEARQ